MWGEQSEVKLQKQSRIPKPQTGPGERGWLLVWFAFGALILRRFTHSRVGVLGKEGEKREMEEGGDGCQVKVLMFEENISTFFSLALTNTVGLTAPNCGNSTASL